MKDEEKYKELKGFVALSPILLFAVFYIALSAVAGDFYKVPLTVAFLITCVYAIAIMRGRKLSERIDVFGRGAGSKGIMLMMWIFLLAGAFAESAKTAGCVEATVNLILEVLPSNMLLAGLFAASCVISLSIGTSVGAIVALVPIGAGLASAIDANVALFVGATVGGAFFGDNLSFISDTTIAATSTQDCNMSDKFKANAAIVLPVAIVIFIVYVIMGQGMSMPALEKGSLLKAVPYFVVFVTAVVGMNVMVVLLLGLVFTGAISLITGVCDFYGWLQSMGSGMTGMGELIIVTMLAGGLFEVIQENGGIAYVMRKITKHIKGKRDAELSMAAMIAAADVCTANNTVAIISVGSVVRKISLAYGVDNRKAASILDTFSCCAQGLIPYGAQLLMASGLTAMAPTDILPYLYYPMALGIFALLSIFLRFPRKYS